MQKSNYKLLKKKPSVCHLDSSIRQKTHQKIKHHISVTIPTYQCMFCGCFFFSWFLFLPKTDVYLEVGNMTVQITVLLKGKKTEAMWNQIVWQKFWNLYW